MSFIEQNLYNQILQNMPILCVDGVLTNDSNEVLFLKRLNEPEKGKWWFPGGRVLKNEYLEDSIIRKIKEEINLDVEVIRYLGTTQTIFTTGPFNIQTHTVNYTFLLKNISGNLKIDNLHSDYIWTNKYDELSLHNEIINLLKNKL